MSARGRVTVRKLDEMLQERYIDGVRDGYQRGVLGIPLTVDDVGLSPAQLREKYMPIEAKTKISVDSKGEARVEFHA